METQVLYETQNFKDEYDFQLRLCSILENEPFNHTVFIDRVKQGYNSYGYTLKRFNMKGTRKRIDIYMQTSPEWPHHKIFPIIGIEVKMATDLGHAVIDPFDQVKTYSEDLPQATYIINGKEVPAPSIYLVVTPESFYEGHIYKWKPPNNLPKRIEDYFSGWIAITEVYDRLLQKHGAAVLREKYFITNKWGENGTKKEEKRFNLWT